MKTEEIIQQLDKVSLGRMYQASFKATMRLQIYFIGRTHELMLDFQQKAQGALFRAGGKNGTLDSTSGYAVQSELLRLWNNTFDEWRVEFLQLRRQAVKIPFGVLAVTHDRLIGSRLQVESLKVAAQSDINESAIDGVFDPQFSILLQIAEEYLYGDGMVLSGRIWRIDREARDGINQALMDGIVNQKSAWDIAKNLEQFIGAGADCPRWTSSRLYGMTAKEKVTSTSGLMSGNDCNGQGVSYNALRLARTEIQKIHSLATDKMMKMQPWVESEQIRLSLSHPKPDECDDAANGGANSDGVYPIGTIELPIHPNCFCYKTAVLMDEKAFTSEINQWLKGGDSAMMDEYARNLGVDLSAALADAAINLAVWLFSNELKDWLK